MYYLNLVKYKGFIISVFFFNIFEKIYILFEKIYKDILFDIYIYNFFE
jgi:hypothetical protein